MSKFKFWATALVALTSYTPAAFAQHAPAYSQFVVAEDVVMQYVRGELRFCQRQNLKGSICGTHTKLFGKTLFEVGDWWHALTFAQAYTGLPNIEVTQVAPGPNGSSLIIHFKQVTLTE